MYLRRTAKFRRPRNSEGLSTRNGSQRRILKEFLFPCGAIEVLLSRRGGETWIHVRLCIWNSEILLTGKYRPLYKALYNWSWSFSPPSVTSIEVLWGRDLLPPWVRRYSAVWSDRIRGYDCLEGRCGSPLSFVPYIFIHKMLSGCWTAECSEDYIWSRSRKWPLLVNASFIVSAYLWNSIVSGLTNKQLFMNLKAYVALEENSSQKKELVWLKAMWHVQPWLWRAWNNWTNCIYARTHFLLAHFFLLSHLAIFLNFNCAQANQFYAVGATRSGGDTSWHGRGRVMASRYLQDGGSVL